MTLAPLAPAAWTPTPEYPTASLWTAARACEAGTRLRVRRGSTRARRDWAEPCASLGGAVTLREGDILTLCELVLVGGHMYVRAWIDQGGAIPEWIAYDQAAEVLVELA
jgi:hypothetical protein